MRMIPRLAVALAAMLVAAVTAGAQEVKRPLGVVELFTSQGCNSCPPADETLARLAKRDDLIALSFHVDYWDYLGWRDTLAQPMNTQRQQGYQRAFQNRSVYTPQAVVNGRTHTQGARQGEIDRLLLDLDKDGQGMQVDVSAAWSGDSMVINLGAGNENTRKAHVLVVYFDMARPVEIARGENQGKTVTYVNAVTSLQSVGVWHGQPTRLEVPIAATGGKGKGGCAILLQKVSKDGVPGPILGATLLAIPTI